MGTQPLPWAPAASSGVREFEEINARFDALEAQLADYRERLDRVEAALTPPTVEACVEEQVQIGDGRYRFVTPGQAQQIRAEGKGARLRAVRVQPLLEESRPELGPTRELRYLGGS